MTIIFWGVLLSFIRISVAIGNLEVTMLPGFISYAVIALGLTQMAAESEHFRTGRTLSIVLVVLHVILSGMELMPGRFSLFFSLIPSLAATVLNIMVLYYIAKGILDMEEKYQRFLNGQRVMEMWKKLVIMIPVMWGVLLVGSLLTIMTSSGGLGMLLIVAVVVLVITYLIYIIQFLVALYRSQKQYHNPPYMPI